MRRSPKFVWFFVVAVAGLMAAWFVYGIHRRPLITLDDGTVARDLSAAEAGVFAADRFMPLRAEYLQSLKSYNTLSVEPIAATVEASAERFDRLMGVKVQASEANTRVAARVGPDAMTDLARQVALVVNVAGGLPRSEYERRIPPDRTPTVPVNLDESRAPELFGPTPPGNDAIRRAFARSYDEYAADGGHLVEAVAVEPGGWLVQLYSAPTARMLAPAPSDQSSSQAREVKLSGNISAMALQFNGPPTPWTVLRDRHAELDRASVTLVVVTKSGDRYPLGANFYFDPDAGRWELLGVWQKVSLRAMQGPALAL